MLPLKKQQGEKKILKDGYELVDTWFFRLQGIKAAVSGAFEDVKFKISEGYKQNWSWPGSALLAASVLNLRSSNTQETVDAATPWY